VEPHVVEDEELGLGPDVAGVGDAGGLEVLGGLPGHEAGVARVALAGQRVVDEHVDRQRPAGPERVDERRVRVGDQDHVRFLDLLEAADRRAVEPDALLEHVGRELRRRHREVLHQAGQVTETHVDDFDALVADELQHLVGGSLFHDRSLQPLMARPSLLRLTGEAAR
jgi:hypothetical protein